MPQTLLGFDFGRLRIGVAVGNTVTCSARALTIVDSEPLEQRWEAIAALIEEWRPDALVVGRPAVPPQDAGEGHAVAASSGQTFASSGQIETSNVRQARASSAGEAAASNVRETAARCERFARQLAGRFGLKVELVDESGTSLEAAASLAERRRGAGGSSDAGVQGVARTHGTTHGATSAGRRGRRTAHRDADDAEAAAIILRQYLSRR